MKYTKLGRTGLDCSRLGFGTWQLGGERWHGLAPEDSVSLLEHALDAGVNTYDAAIVYGQYRGELNERRSRALEHLGNAFGDKSGKRGQAFICLKLGQLDEMSHRAIYQPMRMVDELNRALRELKTDYVDICLVHAPSLHEVKDGRPLAVVQTIQALGKARFVGYSFEAEPEQARLALSMGGIDVMMFQYNLLDEECGDVIDLAEEQGVGCLIGGPFKRGYLSGTYDKPEDLPLEDHYWKWNLDTCRGKVEETLAKVAKLKMQAGGAKQLRQQSLRHILGHPGAACAVVGHRAVSEVDENAQAIDEIFSGQTLTHGH